MSNNILSSHLLLDYLHKTEPHPKQCRVSMKKKFSKTPLDLGKADFKVAISRGLSCNTWKIIGIIGNAAVGKSTLIASLQGESSSQLDKAFNQLRRVDDNPKPTAGIDSVPHPILKTWIHSAASSRRFPFQSPAPPTHVTAFASCSRSGHSSTFQQCRCRMSLSGSKATRTAFLTPCQPQRGCARVCQLLDMPSTYQLWKI